VKTGKVTFLKKRKQGLQRRVQTELSIQIQRLLNTRGGTLPVIWIFAIRDDHAQAVSATAQKDHHQNIAIVGLRSLECNLAKRSLAEEGRKAQGGGGAQQ
jgi:hypothetical protein